MSGFYRAKTVSEALNVLAEKKDITVLAGGTDLVVARREGKTVLEDVLDITGIEELKKIVIGEDSIFIGAAVTFSGAENDEAVNRYCPVLAKAASVVGSPQIRSRGTFGGNAANASPAADSIPALAVLNAKVELQSVNGSRSIPVTEFIEGMGKTLRRPDELITGFRIPLSKEKLYWSYDKIGRRNALSISRMNGACVLVQDNGIIKDARICIGAAIDRPTRFEKAEKHLIGKEPTEKLFEEAGRIVRETIKEKVGDRPSFSYKLPVSEGFTVRLLEEALESI